MSKKNTNKNNRAQSSSQQDTQRKATSKGNQTDVRNVDDEQRGNFDISPSKGYQAAGRGRDQDSDEEQVGNRSSSGDRSLQGASRNMNQEQDDTRGRMASSKDRWSDDQDMAGTDRKNLTSRNFTANNKDITERDAHQSKSQSGSKR